MSRLTTNKPTSEMNMTELAHNGCYAEERLARYRDFDRDIDARDFARELMVSYNELVDDEIFDDTMFENMQYDATTIEGLIALFYRNLWAMADLHSKLKHYEDLEEAGRLLNTHQAAVILAEAFGYEHPCNFNGIDEWFPEACNCADLCPDGKMSAIACWEQYFKIKLAELKGGGCDE